MRKPVRLLTFTAACVLTLTLSPEAKGQAGAAALVEEVRGVVILRRAAPAKPVRLDRRADVARRLYPDEVLECRRRAYVRIRLGGEVREFRGPASFTIPQRVPRPDPSQAALEAYGHIGGRKRPVTVRIILYSPTDRSNVLPDGLSVRWLPFRTRCRASLRIETPDGDVLWRRDSVNARAGSLDARDARRALADYRSKTGAASLLLKLDDACGNSDHVVFSLLSAERERTLAEELARWDTEPSRLLAHLGRASSYASHEMFPEAADEYEAALALAPHSRDLLTKTIDAHRQTGNDARANELSRRLPR